MYAVVTISGKQYIVSPAQTITVDRLSDEEGKTVTFEAMLVGDDKSVKVGTPSVAGATVKAKVVSHLQGDKIHVRRYKSKVRYRKHIGFRAQLTKLEIISVG